MFSKASDTAHIRNQNHDSWTQYFATFETMWEHSEPPELKIGLIFAAMDIRIFLVIIQLDELSRFLSSLNHFKTTALIPRLRECSVCFDLNPYSKNTRTKWRLNFDVDATEVQHLKVDSLQLVAGAKSSCTNCSIIMEGLNTMSRNLAFFDSSKPFDMDIQTSQMSTTSRSNEV
ncbi:hypothetical protein BCON_0250g00130 [Botryotinia convoluta]|uniref:Uncharacterized protein n=1 Tax=Botryotinia convoluta TaxID=54673 RepID=A0A4Z1HN20_9HELO|nr:hypothetical protein BCON_0250g00130 [Botryotinia convoluta]